MSVNFWVLATHQTHRSARAHTARYCSLSLTIKISRIINLNMHAAISYGKIFSISMQEMANHVSYGLGQDRWIRSCIYILLLTNIHDFNSFFFPLVLYRCDQKVFIISCQLCKTYSEVFPDSMPWIESILFFSSIKQNWHTLSWGRKKNYSVGMTLNQFN